MCFLTTQNPVIASFILTLIIILAYCEKGLSYFEDVLVMLVLLKQWQHSGFCIHVISEDRVGGGTETAAWVIDLLETCVDTCD